MSDNDGVPLDRVGLEAQVESLYLENQEIIDRIKSLQEEVNVLKTQGLKNEGKLEILKGILGRPYVVPAEE